MTAAETLRACRLRSGLSLRELAARAETSHSTLAAYEAGRKIPSTATLSRIVRATGHAVDFVCSKRVDGPDLSSRGRELEEVLELAAMFPARHEPSLKYPKFGMRP